MNIQKISNNAFRIIDPVSYTHLGGDGERLRGAERKGGLHYDIG